MMSTLRGLGSGECGQGRVGVSSMWTSTQKVRVTDVILSSSHVNMLAFWTIISSLDGRNWKFFVNIN